MLCCDLIMSDIYFSGVFYSLIHEKSYWYFLGLCVFSCVFFLFYTVFGVIYGSSLFFGCFFFSLVGEKSDPDKFWRYFFCVLFFSVLCRSKGYSCIKLIFQVLSSH